MSKWCQHYFGQRKLPKSCILFLGITRKDHQKKILKIFKNVREIKEREIPKSYLVKFQRKNLLIVFNIYGAALVLDVLRILYEGGCKKLIAAGQCGTEKDIPITTIIIPSKVKCMDGVTNIENPEINFAYPNKTLFEQIKRVTQEESVKFFVGPIISGPSVLHKIPDIEKEARNRKYLAQECELSTFLYFAKKMRMRAAGILVVRDNPKISLLQHPKNLYLGRLKIAKIATAALTRDNRKY